MTARRLLPWALVVAAGLGLWSFVRRESGAQEEERSRLQAAIGESERRTQALQDTRDALAREVAEAGRARAAPSPPTPVVPAAPEPPRPAGRQAIIVGMDGAIAESLVRAFALTEVETGALRVAVAETRAELTRLAVEHARFVQGSRASPREAVISVEPFEEEGREVRAGLLKQFETVLGADRFAVFMLHYSGGPLTTDMGNFGAGRRTVTIARFPNNYTVSDAAPALPGTRSGGGAGRFSPRTLAELKDRSFPELFAKFAAELAAMPLYSQP